MKTLRKHSGLMVTAAIVLVSTLVIAFALIRVRAAEPIESATMGWTESGHANWDSPSFTFWQNGEPALIPARCASCHSLTGMVDYLGLRGTETGSVSGPVATGTVISCNACHNAGALRLEAVEFPSGAMVNAIGREAVCLHCHQGLASTESVAEEIAGLEDDEVYPDLGFISVHYGVAAATLVGSQARGGYQYPGMEYVGRFEHVENYRACDECHNPHSLQVDPLACSSCHVYVTSTTDLDTIRHNTPDYDWDGDVSEGIAGEVETFEELLYQAMQRYAREVAGMALVYDAEAFPYFFEDPEGDGEAGSADAYSDWTPRLVRVAYNYHLLQQDRGAWAHNAEYVLQLLYDSLLDLSEVVPTEIERLRRPEAGG